MRDGDSSPATACRVAAFLFVLIGSACGAARAQETFVLLVNPATGAVAMRSDFASTVWIDQYSVASPSGSLSPANWNSLEDQAIFDWSQTAATPALVSESNAVQTSFQNGTGFSLGNLFNTVGATADLQFQVRFEGSQTASVGTVSYGSFTAPPNPTHEPFPEPAALAPLSLAGLALLRRRRAYGKRNGAGTFEERNGDGNIGFTRTKT